MNPSAKRIHADIASVRKNLPSCGIFCTQDDSDTNKGIKSINTTCFLVFLLLRFLTYDIAHSFLLYYLVSLFLILAFSSCFDSRTVRYTVRIRIVFFYVNISSGLSVLVTQSRNPEHLEGDGQV